jgi:hypothetical protein
MDRWIEESHRLITLFNKVWSDGGIWSIIIQISTSTNKSTTLWKVSYRSVWSIYSTSKRQQQTFSSFASPPVRSTGARSSFPAISLSLRRETSIEFVRFSRIYSSSSNSLDRKENRWSKSFGRNCNRSSRKKYKHPVAVKVDGTIIQPIDIARYLWVIMDK